MSDFNTLKNQAEQYRKNNNFAEALPLYKKLWEEYRESCNEWIGWGYAYCLKQQEKYLEALNICREVYKMNSDFEMIKTIYAWCIYYTEIAIDRVIDEEQFLKAGNAIIKLTNKEDKYSPYIITVFKILDYLSKKQPYQAGLILEWTDKLNPDTLDTESFVFIDKDGKSRELPSKKEQYYMYLTKALLEKEMYKECITANENALKTFNKFHYDNDIWFKWRIALSYKGLKDYDKALHLLKNILLLKKEWFVQKEIAEIYFLQGKMQEAMNYALDAALNSGTPEMKINLFKLLFDILISNNQLNEAKKHLEYIYLLKKDSSNKVDEKILELIKQHNINTSKSSNLKQLEKDLKELWYNLKFKNKEQYSGFIKTILSNGKAGFIEAEDKKQYYFELKNFKGNSSLIKQGLKVKFYLEEGFDKKKNKKSLNAVNITPNNK